MLLLVADPEVVHLEALNHLLTLLDAQPCVWTLCG